MAKNNKDKNNVDKKSLKKDSEVDNETTKKESKADLEKRLSIDPPSAKIDEDKKKDEKKKPVFLPKGKWDRAKYIQSKSKHVEYKADSFIHMSPAFQELTKFPGFPQGHVHMVYGNSDVGKTTMLLELAKYAQQKSVLPVFIITEKKWSWKRAKLMGINTDPNELIFNDDFSFIEEACDYIVQTLKDQATGELQSDIIILWDSVGATPSRAEWEAYEEHEKLIAKAIENGQDIKEIKKSSVAMMVTAKVLREQIERKIQHLITATRKVESPFFATLFIVNHGYTSPNPMGPASLVPYGGGGIKLACTFVFRQGKVSGSATRKTNTVKGVDFTWGLQVPLEFEKNHLNGISAQGDVIVTPHGYITATKESEAEYIKEHKNGWENSFDGYFGDKDKDKDDDDDLPYDPETGEILPPK